MVEADLITLVGQELKGLSTNFVAQDYSNAVDDAERETGFTLPTTDAFHIQWLKNRTKRHLLFYFLTQSVSKFKFKQINLHQIFEHAKAMLEMMDKEYEKALEEFMYEFAGASPIHMFSHKIDAGFAYDATGNDITYDSDQEVIVTPGDEA